MPGGFGFPSSYRSAEICCFTPRIKTHASTTVRFWIYIGRGWVPLGGGRPPPPGSPSPLPARGPPASPPPPRSGGGGPEGVARGFSGKTARVAGGLAGWLAGGGTPGGGVRDATAGVRPREREAQWVGRSRLRVRELIPPAALFRGPLSVLSLRLSPPGVSVRPSVRLSVRRSSGCFWGVPRCRCSLRDPLGGAGAQRGGFSGNRKRASAGAALKKLQHRRAWGATVVQTWVQVWLGGAGAGAARGWPALAGGLVEARVRGARGVCLRKGGCEGADRKVGERGLALSLSLSGLSLALSPAGGAPCTSPWERSVGLLSSVRPSLILILFHPPSPAPVGCGADPASLTAAPERPLLGGLPIVSGLEGVW